ncbi:hypothetical protein [Telluribacter humicola]|uniref:hypothetical protein n=1 Tax=Telluribacter humicola TaxID=1720261 RepID=UPI001A97823D|nr:hypothetical protein [Telluribacter humicola]
MKDSLIIGYVGPSFTTLTAQAIEAAKALELARVHCPQLIIIDPARVELDKLNEERMEEIRTMNRDSFTPVISWDEFASLSDQEFKELARQLEPPPPPVSLFPDEVKQTIRKRGYTTEMVLPVVIPPEPKGFRTFVVDGIEVRAATWKAARKKANRLNDRSGGRTNVVNINSKI